uniref:Uncharacterized protein n=1 Tax=Onchocerca volvulus TaxID=6282 RepID=A0A8R1TZH1_ONCVO
MRVFSPSPKKYHGFFDKSFRSHNTNTVYRFIIKSIFFGIENKPISSISPGFDRILPNTESVRLESYLLYKLICYRNIEPQSHRPTLHSVRTHPAAPLPLMSTYTAAPGQLQGLAFAYQQAFSV